MSTYFIRAPMNDELYHFGIKGMKWGFRKDRYNQSYSRGERKIDKAMYGRGGVKRINRRINRGVVLNDARAIESRRLVRARRNAKLAAGVGGIAGSLVGYAVGSKYAGRINNRIRSNIGMNDWVNEGRPSSNAGFFKKAAFTAKGLGKEAIYNNAIGRYPYKILGGAGGYIGGRIGSRLGRSAYMLYSGYSPRHFR